MMNSGYSLEEIVNPRPVTIVNFPLHERYTVRKGERLRIVSLYVLSSVYCDVLSIFIYGVKTVELHLVEYPLIEIDGRSRREIRFDPELVVDELCTIGKSPASCFCDLRGYLTHPRREAI